MSQEQWSTVNEYFSRQLVPSDQALDATLVSSAEADLPSITLHLIKESSFIC